MVKTTIQLDHPFKIEGEDIKEIRIRRPKVRDQKLAAKAGSVEEQEITLLSNLCEVTPGVIEELDLSDYRKLQKAFEDFLSPSESTS